MTPIKKINSMLITGITAKGITVSQATEDTYIMTIHSALARTVECDRVVITGEDLLAVLTSLALNYLKNAYFQKSWRGNAPSKL